MEISYLTSLLFRFRLGQLDSKHRVKNWDQIECDWEKAEPNQKRRNSPVLRVHFKENGSDHSVDETNRDMSVSGSYTPYFKHSYNYEV